MLNRPRMAVAALVVLTTAPLWGGGRLLSYHEAIYVQSAREMAERGDWLVPTIGGTVWLEKPPLVQWLVLTIGAPTGVFAESVARLPALLAALAIALGVATLALRRFGPTVGWLAGAIQATTLWSVSRGRLIEPDVFLAAMIVWALVILDQARQSRSEDGQPVQLGWRWAFFLLLGAMSLVKGIGFGAVLTMAAVVAVLVWDRDWTTAKRLAFPPGWLLAAVLTVVWPYLVLQRYPQAGELWLSHVRDRLDDSARVFAGRSLGDCLFELLGQVPPWLPFALTGLWISGRRAIRERCGGDRLLWAWGLAPSILLSCATVKNTHYFLHALPPLSVWSAMGVVQTGRWLAAWGWSPIVLRRAAIAGLTATALIEGFIYDFIAPRYDTRSQEQAFYRDASKSRLRRDEPVTFLYDDWDRAPYSTPFGPVPHDLAVRLYYSDRPAIWVKDARQVPSGAAFVRERDLSVLKRRKMVETLDYGPPVRWDRTYLLIRLSDQVAEDPSRGRF